MAVRDVVQAAAGALGGGNPNAWDITKAVYNPGINAWDTTESVYAQQYDYNSPTFLDGNPRGITYSSDGTNFYIVGDSNNTIYQFTTSRAWTAEAALITSTTSFSVTSQDSLPSNVFFKPDGTVMYMIGRTNRRVYEYSLSTAWDVSTASYTSNNFYVGSQELTPVGLYFRSDGLKMYFGGAAYSAVYEYTLSTAWDITSASYVQNFSVSSQESAVKGFSFAYDGTKMFVNGSSGDDINEYTLSTAWDISTASYLQNFSISTRDTEPWGTYFREDGGVFYFVGNTNDRLFKFLIGGFSVAAQETAPAGLFFKPDGTKMYVLGYVGDDINEYNLSTAWDIDTASYSQSFYVGTQDGNSRGFTFSTDGTKLYTAGISNQSIFQYSLSTAWDVSTMSYASKSFSVSSKETAPWDVKFSSDGTKMYVIGSNSDSIHQYSLSTAWDISTASFTQSFSVSTQETNPYGFWFKDNGTEVYVIGASEAIHQYSLSTAWDISTASYTQSRYVSEEAAGGFYSLAWNDDGTKVFVLCFDVDKVLAYSISEE